MSPVCVFHTLYPTLDTIIIIYTFMHITKCMHAFSIPLILRYTHMHTLLL